jgi:hypothetical protein
MLPEIVLYRQIQDGGQSMKVAISPLVSHLGTKFQRLCLGSHGRPTRWNSIRYEIQGPCTRKQDGG